MKFVENMIDNFFITNFQRINLDIFFINSRFLIKFEWKFHLFFLRHIHKTFIDLKYKKFFHEIEKFLFDNVIFVNNYFVY